MNQWQSDDRKWCFFHPTELVVGICALCLKERLLALASAKKNSLHKTLGLGSATKKSPSSSSSSSLNKIFALTALLNRLDIKDHKSSVDDHFCRSSTSTQDDSFISIKFEDNGIASWEKGKCAATEDKKIKCLVEHSKPRGALRWRRRIGHIFKLIRLKKSNKGIICHVGAKQRKSISLNTIDKM
ncbi:hypothetical protein SASPL_116305 [Salvia splendens]|uniref:Uncharacterized protein n=1 Tax=Salvia splendens TaxID=180675 RepID=A0A8X8XXL3_SALSN|nr:uncharacterized protein LOC121807343 [Salvia splendens]KAG6419793.1 hypothetical protein SASPL_116305 [Salvia splendens]